MNRFLILANNGSQYYRDPRWPKYNVAFLSWFLSFTGIDVVGVLDRPRDSFVEKIDEFISSVSPDDTTFVYISGVGGNRNGINGFLPYDYSNIDEGIIDIANILDEFQGRPVIVFIDVYSPRTSFRKFDFTGYAVENCYIAYSCSDTQWSVADGTAFTGKLIHSMFGHSGTTLSNVLDSFQTAINQDRKTKSKKACAHDSLQAITKQAFFPGVLNNQDYQSQKGEPKNFQWVYSMWQKLKSGKAFDL